MNTAYLAVWFEGWNRPDSIALAGLIVTVIAVTIAIATLHRGNLNSSIASMLALNSEIRDMWDQYIAAFPDQEHLDRASAEEIAEFEEVLRARLESLMNVLEIAAAIEVEGTLSGVSRVLMRDYLRRTMADIIGDEYTSPKVSGLLQDGHTFIFIRRFLKERSRLSVVMPPQWYEDPKVSLRERAKSLFRY